MEIRLRRLKVKFIIWLISFFYPIFKWMDRACYWLLAQLGILYRKVVIEELNAPTFPYDCQRYLNKRFNKKNVDVLKLISYDATYDVIFKNKKGDK